MGRYRRCKFVLPVDTGRDGHLSTDKKSTVLYFLSFLDTVKTLIGYKS